MLNESVGLTKKIQLIALDSKVGRNTIFQQLLLAENDT